MQRQQNERWTMAKALFFNFWYYPDQEFEFKDGCAVLRGHNGSGKSVTTQTLITVLLDGDTRSHKLDPFGGRERTLKNTLLGEEGILNVSERIGYFAMEFKKGSQEVYKTIGIGVEADREKVSPKVWYFILDGKRIGHGSQHLKLYKESMMDGELKKIPLDEKAFRLLVEQQEHCGKVYSRREEYADKVNKQLFGFDSLDSYNGLMELLIQIRSPKLSDNSRPEGVVEVLNDALPQLTNEELRPLTTSIEAIDRIEKDLLTYKKDLKAISNLNQVYIEYNQASLVEKADEVVKSRQSYEKTRKEVGETEKALIKIKKRLQELIQERGRQENQLAVYREEKADLGFEQIEGIMQKLSKTEARIKELDHKIKTTEQKISRAQQQRRDHMRSLEEYELALDQARKELTEFLLELGDTAEQLHYEEHGRYAEHFTAHQQDAQYGFTAWKDSLKRYSKFVNETRKKLTQYDQLNQHMQDNVNALGNVQQKMDEAHRFIEDCMDRVDKELVQIVENIQQWVHTSTVLAVPEEVMDRLNRTLVDVFVDIDREAYLSPLTKWVEQCRQQQLQARLKLEHHLDRVQQAMEETRTEIAAWQADKEVEPFFAESKQAEWNKLKERNIPFVPFYEAFEFVDGVKDEEKRRVQSALFEAGLLSAVVVPMEYVAEAQQLTAVVDYMPARGRNLTEILSASDQPEYQYILAGIPLEPQDVGYILPTGGFKNGFVEGQASQIIEPLFIGKAAREAYRKAEIDRLEQVYIELLTEKDEHERAIQEVDQQLEKLEHEVASFPSLDNLKLIHEQKQQEERRKEEIYEPERKRIEEQIDHLHLQMKSIMDEIKGNMEWSELPLTSEAYEQEESELRNYADCLMDIEKAFMQQSNASSHVQSYRQQVGQQEGYIEEYEADLADDHSGKDRALREMEGHRRLLKELGSEDIIARMKELTKQIDELIPHEIRRLDKEEVMLGRDEESEKARLEDLVQTELPFRKVMAEAWEKAFSDHFRAGFIERNELKKEEYSEHETGQPLTSFDQAKLILQQYRHLLDSNRELIERVKVRLAKRFNELNIDLFHYDMELSTRTAEHVPTVASPDESKAAVLRLMSEQMQRMIITMDVNGERVSPAYAVQQLEQRITDLEVEANEKDRELYERILVNTLGETIRQKVHYVQRWENEMNKFMEHENLIKFRLKWVPKRSEKEDELHTRQLVDALKKDSKWVDLEEISRHFRSKIKEAKRRHDKQEDHALNLQQIMREVLDYRKWFDFEIYFTKKGDQEKRLTRRTYGELSGGQRVLAMITPVLAALYAKYDEANEDCPRLFTLDEAFSRVDDDNVNVMFEYIYKLNFNYILNSQSLWGCFESVPSLDIYELVRPDNRPTVAVASYYWNGTKITRKGSEDAKEADYEFAN